MKNDKCIVLDMDETMLHVLFEQRVKNSVKELKKMNFFTDPLYYPIRDNIVRFNFRQFEGDNYVEEEMWAITRPHLRDFLRFSFSYFNYVIIWSAGTYEYVNLAIRNIFKDLPLPHIIYTRDDCAEHVNSEYTKPLKKLYDLNRDIRPENTFILDDKAMSFINDPDNGILIPVYKPNPADIPHNRDDNLLKLMEWFSLPEVSQSSDVRKLDKR